MQAHRLLFLLLAGLLTTDSAVAHARHPHDAKHHAAPAAPAPQQKLEKINEEIGKLRHVVSKTQQDRSAAQDTLDKLGAQISTQSRQLEKTRSQRESLAQRLKTLQDRNQRLAQALHTQKGYLRGQVRAAYMQGPRSPLQLWLSQKNPADFDRTLEYYRRLNRARLDNIRHIEELSFQIAENSRRVDSQHKQLEKIEDTIASTQESLEQKRQAQQALAQKLELALQAQQTRLSQLRQNAKSLNNLIAKLAQEAARRAKLEKERQARLQRERRLAQQRARAEALRKQHAEKRPKHPSQRLLSEEKEPVFPLSSPPNIRFGQLPAPVNGPITVRFGATRGEASVPWQGIVFSAPQGAPVRAVASGRVVYASAMRGYGMMMIVDHGNGLLSLYSHLQNPVKDVNAPVHAGERIASVGPGRELGESGLYFEIRQHGKPVNPLRFLQVR